MKLTRHSDPDHDFSLDHYREILTTILKTHKTLSFKQWENDLYKPDKFVLMRHDVEFSLEAALRLAEIDASYGIKSTFFLLQTSEYNCFEKEQAKIIRKILSFGHDIGLHYDIGLLQNLDGHESKIVCQKQIDLFEAFFDTTIYAMSAHEPMRAGIKPFGLPGVANTYDPEFMANMKYLSDSNQVWREGVVTKNLASHDRIHLLTHEYIWHPYGWHWSALLFVEAQQKFNAAWKRAEGFINQYREGFSLRKTKDEEFKKLIK